ncbi:MAG: hypothetical protein MK193_01365 [Lentisphaeria bacterium]|nr:hypothetical protein [Lentisphaeria bacterium]
MKTQLPARRKKNLPVRAASKKKQSTGNSNVVFSYLVVLIISGALLLAGLGRVYLERRTDFLLNEQADKKEELQQLKQKHSNLLLVHEEYLTGEYIKVRARAMGLQPPQPGQILKMNQPKVESHTQTTSQPGVR